LHTFTKFLKPGIENIYHPPGNSAIFTASAQKTIGFVPTMGALHRAIYRLIAQAKQAMSSVVCSIFVNPTQFNDPKDLENYPRPIEADIAKLEQAGCDVLFNPQ
jgi:pantoate--beta-alanine ligase